MKRSVCGNAMAEKDQIQRMVKTLLSLEEIPQNDAADALGLAICHTHSTGILSTAKPI
jgi:crossover junction endodeoxyribonuclease RuvC